MYSTARPLQFKLSLINIGSWSNQIGSWQWYIHGSGKTSEYLGLSPDFKNPADTSDAQGVRITIVCHSLLCGGKRTNNKKGWNLLLEWTEHGAL